MKTYLLDNGIKFIYEYRPGNLTSFCIGFEAGALMEDGYKLGTAHALEHMLFKGTKTRTEEQINKQLDEIFGFNNAMTNYPYCIYYGTTLTEDFYNGFELYSDIILNPGFEEEGFKEEINIICEELVEWKDDLVQYCEDELFKNAFKNIRIKELIIGNEDSVRAITLQDLKKFYNDFYAPGNCVISVASSMNFENTLDIIKDIYGSWNKPFIKKRLFLYEDNIPGRFIESREGINGSKIQYIFPIHSLSDKEIKALKIFNASFGEGTSSLLYDSVRTKNGLVYDIGSTIKYEKGIKLFSINLSTSVKNVETTIQLIDNIIEEIKLKAEYFDADKISKNSKRNKIKTELNEERAIVLCKNLTTNEIMFGNIECTDEINEEDIHRVINKVLINPSIQVIKS